MIPPRTASSEGISPKNTAANIDAITGSATIVTETKIADQRRNAQFIEECPMSCGKIAINSKYR